MLKFSSLSIWEIFSSLWLAKSTIVEFAKISKKVEWKRDNGILAPKQNWSYPWRSGIGIISLLLLGSEFQREDVPGCRPYTLGNLLPVENMSTLRYRPKHSPCWTRSNNPSPFQRPVISGQDFDYHSCPDVLEARCIDQNRSIFTVRTFGQKVVDRFQADWSIFKRLDFQNWQNSFQSMSRWLLSLNLWIF